MCGFFAIVRKSDASPVLNLPAANKAAQFILNRGPDGNACLHDDKAFFFHSRLRIIDPSNASDQPMKSCSGRYLLVFNGEIYNYKDLRNELLSNGVNFRTSSDTEVLLEALIHWGISAVKKLNGVFAFCFYDNLTSNIMLARDQFGVKPIYYSEVDNQLLVASLPYPIQSYAKQSPNYSLKHLCSQLFLRAPLPGNSMVKNIKAVKPGEVLEFKPAAGSLQRQQMQFDDPEGLTCLTGQFDHTVISDALKSQTPEEMPFASLLSGGVDSSVLAYEIESQHPGKCDFYCGKVAGNQYDESGFAKQTADFLGTKVKLVPVDLQMDLEQLEQLTLARQVPLAMHNEITMTQLSKAISERHKVVFSGEGADELFAGYSRLFGIGFDFTRRRFSGYMPFSQAINRALKITDINPNDPLLTVLNRYFYFPPNELKEILHPELESEFLSAFREIYEFFKSLYRKDRHQSLFDLVSEIMIKVHLPALLQMVDGTAMSNGVEIRVPFIAPRVVQMAYSLKNNEKLRWNSLCSLVGACNKPIAEISDINNTAKWCLKQSYKNKLPDNILFRRKMGFPTPLGIWTQSEVARYFSDQITSGHSKINTWVEGTRFKLWQQRKAASGDNYGKQLWMLVNLEIYLRQSEHLIGEL